VLGMKVKVIWCITCDVPMDGLDISEGQYFDYKTGSIQKTVKLELTEKDILRMHNGHDYEVREYDMDDLGE